MTQSAATTSQHTHLAELPPAVTSVLNDMLDGDYQLEVTFSGDTIRGVAAVDRHLDERYVWEGHRLTDEETAALHALLAPGHDHARCTVTYRPAD